MSAADGPGTPPDRKPATTGDRTEPEYGEAWVYESIVKALPGIDVSERAAVALQFLGFEAALLVLASVYGLPEAVPGGTVAIGVATGGSLLMQEMSRRIRAADVPEDYAQVLFGSSIEVVLGLLAFLGVVTYVFVVDPRGLEVAGVPLRTADRPLLETLLGERPPAAATYLGLLVLWDVSYRIGTGWWAAVVAAWRSRRFDFDAATAADLRRVDRLNLGFGLLQLALLPFLWEHPLLFVAVAGHVAAVLLVGGYALVQLRPENVSP
ncbi:MAG: hypothetical protein V5A23_07645 [Halobacteriales archaeon]